MNSFLAFFHGEQAFVGFLVAVVVVLIGFPLLIYVWLWHTTISELKLALAYFVVMAAVCGLVAFNSPGSAFILTFTAFFMAFFLTLPWNVITLLALYLAGNPYVSDQEFATVMLLGAGINSMLLYLLAKKMRSKIH